ncbi:MAG: ABC transporter permease [Actinomycetota bacterium]
MRKAFDLTLAALAGVALTFLVLPLIAIFVRIPPEALFEALGSHAARAALIVSLKTSVIAHVFILALGTPFAYLVATRTFRGKRMVVALVELPLVLPPAVAGIGLLVTFGRLGLLGGSLDALGISVPFTQAAVVLAVMFVASPFYVRQAIVAFEAIDRELLDASRTLGTRPWRTFRRVALPLARGGLGAGSALAFARGLGEFGATIVFAGSSEGVTQTLSLAIYAQLTQDFDVALAIGALLVVVSAAILVSVKVLPSWTRLQSISGYRSATSISS